MSMFAYRTLCLSVLLLCGLGQQAVANEADQAVQDITLAGVDADANGVRDDVDSYIRSTFTAAPQQAAVMQSARALQAALFTDVQNVMALKAASNRVGDAVNCIFTRFTVADGNGPAKVVTDIENLTVNTPERRAVYEAYNKALSGTVSSLPEQDTCE